jgi:hypothetical protein
LPKGLAGVQGIVDRLMAKQPEERYPSARSFLDDLDERAHARTVVQRKRST